MLAICSILFIVIGSAFGQVAPNIVGKSCSIEFYNKIVKPASDAFDKIFQEDQGVDIRQSNNLAPILAKIQKDLNDTIVVPKNFRGAEADDYRKEQSQSLMASQGCTGAGSFYLTCDQIREVCVCKNYFPFNNTLERGQCVAVAGSICGVSSAFEIPCEGNLACARDGVGDTRYCGGSTAFNKVAMESRNSGVVNIGIAPQTTFFLATFLISYHAKLHS